MFLGGDRGDEGGGRQGDGGDGLHVGDGYDRVALREDRRLLLYSQESVRYTAKRTLSLRSLQPDRWGDVLTEESL